MRPMRLTKLLALLLICALASCRGDAPKSGPDGPSALDVALEELRTLEAPSDVDPDVFETLRAALEAQLSTLDAARLVSSTPKGPHNAIEPELVDNGSGGLQLQWYYRNAGDYDLNGEVNAADLAPLALYFRQRGPFQRNTVPWHIDGMDRGNDEINAADIVPIAANFLVLVTGYDVYATGTGPEDECWTKIGSVSFSERQRQDMMLPQFSFDVTDYPERDFLVLPYSPFEPSDPYALFSDVVTIPAPEPEATTGTLSGTVTDLEGNPLEGVSVRAGEATATTDAEGWYLISDLEPAEELVVALTLDGYSDGTLLPTILAGETTDGGASLIPRADPVEIDPIAGGAAPVPGFSMVQLTLPPRGLVRSDGTPLEDITDLRLTYIDPTLPAQLSAAPPLRAEQMDGSPAQLESFGMAEVVIDDGLGGKADLADGHTAEMAFEIPASLQGNAPDSIGLYSFDAETGQWIEEGIAVKNPAGTAYIGQVGHFSFWNCDVPLDVACVTVRVVDENGLPVPGAAVLAEGVDYTGTTTKTTNSDGEATFLVLVGGIERYTATRISKTSESVELANPSTTVPCDSSPLVATLVVPGGNNVPPSAHFSINPLPSVPRGAKFDASLSTGNGTPIVKYEWDWDGPNGPLGFEDHGTTSVADHAFPTSGARRVSLRVTNAWGGQEIRTQTVCVD